MFRVNCFTFRSNHYSTALCWMPPSRGGSPMRAGNKPMISISSTSAGMSGGKAVHENGVSVSGSSSSSSGKRKRKAVQPRKAPSKQSSLPTMPSVNVSLLLRALLREAERDPSNLRHPSASTASAAAAAAASTSATTTTNGSPQKVPKRRERDLLPPPQAGYGRGKRSSSAALSATEYELDPSTTAASTATSSAMRATTSTDSHATIKKRPSALQLPGPSSDHAVSKRLARSRSIEPTASAGAGEDDQQMAQGRASSLGPMHYNRPHVVSHHHHPYHQHHHHPGQYQHQPSPLINQTAVMTPPSYEHSLPGSPLAVSHV